MFAYAGVALLSHTSAYVSIRQHTSACASIRTHLVFAYARVALLDALPVGVMHALDLRLLPHVPLLECAPQVSASVREY